MNFVWQLKNKGLIDHMVVAVYAEVDIDATDASIIKFGSWDQYACMPGNDDITMF